PAFVGHTPGFVFPSVIPSCHTLADGHYPKTWRRVGPAKSPEQPRPRDAWGGPGPPRCRGCAAREAPVPLGTGGTSLLRLDARLSRCRCAADRPFWDRSARRLQPVEAETSHRLLDLSGPRVWGRSPGSRHRAIGRRPPREGWFLTRAPRERG